MIRDEEGFLSEFVAYHQMHGFSHIVFFDHGSTDNGLAELEPWIKSGRNEERDPGTSRSPGCILL